MKNVFRSAEFWKSAVMTMPDNSFFELLRSVFGKIKTPYQKQQLINELEIFLLREDIQKVITAYIDQNDAKVIAAVAMFGEPVPGELESFFSGEFSYAQLQDIIVNLEERFILYRFREDKTSAQVVSRFALNPVLEHVLLPFTADISVLFPSASEKEFQADTAPEAMLNDLVLACILSFVMQWNSFFRTEGVIRKRVLDAAKTCFPGIDMKLVLGSLQILGLFYADNDRLVPDNRQFSNFSSLSVRERMEYCAAALLTFSELKSLTGILPPLFRNRIKELTCFIHCFMDSLNTGLLYPQKTLIRLAEVLKAKMGVNIEDSQLLETIEKTGLIVTVSPELKKTGVINAMVKENKKDTKNQYIKIDSGFSILACQGISFADAINLASFLTIRETSGNVRFELNRDSVVRSFDKNISASEIIELLKKLSCGEIDETLVQALNDWEKLYKEVSLKRGIILSLPEKWRYLIKTWPFSELICETAAPGFYLLPENAMDEAASALRNAGIEIIAQRHFKTGNVTSLFNNLPSLSSCASPLDKNSFKAGDTAAKAAKKSDKVTAAALTESFHVILKKLQLGKTEQAELSARIDRKLILCEAQLKEASLRYEKLEARHMDYAGKQNIAKQAITQQSPVEIVLPCALPQGSAYSETSGAAENVERIFGVPKALEKESEELILVIDLTAADHKNENPVIRRIPLGRISLLRRIKKSIFI